MANDAIANQIINLQKQLAIHEVDLAVCNDNKTKLLTNILERMDIVEAYQSIKDLEVEIAKLRQNSTGATIVAPVSGTIISMAYVAGETTRADEAVAVIQAAGKGGT